MTAKPWALICAGLSLVFLAACGAGPAYAAETERNGAEKGQSAWSVSLGAGAMVAPEFEGSDKYEVTPIPFVQVEFMDRFFLSTAEGLGVYLVRNPQWNLGAAVGYNGGRKEKDGDLLKGLGDIDPGAEFGVFLEWTPEPFRAKIEARQGTGDVKGFTATASLGHSLPLLEGLKWDNAVSATYANARYNKTFFGVTKKQSRNSERGYESYSPSGGIKDISFSSSLTYALNDSVSVNVFGEYSYLTGPAADSPLVKAGSKNQAMGGLALIYTFGN